MGLLDEVVGALGAGGGAATPAGTAGAAGGIDAAALVREAVAMLGQPSSGGLGGLGGLLASFEQGGLGHIFQSWVGTGANLPITAEQLQSVLGSGQLGRVAASLGVNPQQVAAGLAQVLPAVIDKLTPHGTLPAAGAAAPDLGALARQLLGR